MKGASFMNYLCIDIGGTSIKYALFNREGEKVSEVFQTPTIKDETSNQILQTVLRLVEEYQTQIKGVAISSAGVVDANGRIAYAGYTIPGYTNTPIKLEVERLFHIPCTVENDVNCACLGEVWKGSAKNTSSAVMLTIGTGVGGAVYLKNELWTGISYTAGEIGYMLIHGKYFQDLASTTALLESYEKKTTEKIDGKVLFERAKGGEFAAVESIQEQMGYLAEGLVNICYLLNPEKIVLGGGIMAQKEYIMPILENQLELKIVDKRFLTTKIEAASLDNDAGMLGALYHFLQKEEGV